MKKNLVARVPARNVSSDGNKVFCTVPVPGDEDRTKVWPVMETATVQMGFGFNLGVGMQVKPRRCPAYVIVSVDQLSEDPLGMMPRYPVSARVLNTTMTPQQCRKLASRLVAAANRAERADREPYPPPEDTVPPVAGSK